MVDFWAISPENKKLETKRGNRWKDEKRKTTAKKLLKEVGAFRKSKGKNEKFDVDQAEDDIDSEDFEIFSYDELHLAYSFTSTP